MVTVAWYPAPFYARAGDEATVTAAELSPGPAPSGERAQGGPGAGQDVGVHIRPWGGAVRASVHSIEDF